MPGSLARYCCPVKVNDSGQALSRAAEVPGFLGIASRFPATSPREFFPGDPPAATTFSPVAPTGEGKGSLPAITAVIAIAAPVLYSSLDRNKRHRYAVKEYSLEVHEEVMGALFFYLEVGVGVVYLDAAYFDAAMTGVLVDQCHQVARGHAVFPPDIHREGTE